MPDLLNQAIAAHRAHDLAAAEALYMQALADQPDRADARYNLATIFAGSGRMPAAVSELKQAVTAKPDFFEAWFLLCECADAVGDQELNRAAGRQATQLKPDHARAWLRYGIALNRLGLDDEAAQAYRQTITLDPLQLKGWINFAVTLKKLGKMKEAETALRQALHLRGDSLATDDEAENHYNLLHWHLALIELGFDRYQTGFAYFRARFKGGTNWLRHHAPQPLWRGQNLAGKTILITAEQGHGDVLMMARYLPLLKEQGAIVWFETHAALVKLFTGWNGADKAGPPGSFDGAAFDYHAPVFDLPYVFGTVIDTIPAQYPYLPCPTFDHINPLPTDHRPTIGVIWSGNRQHAQDARRSIPLQVFSKLFSTPSCRFISFNHEISPEEEKLLAAKDIINLAPQLTDFAATTCYVAQCDLMIACDTALLHLAGGMGKTVWGLIPFTPDWRWGLGRTNCPWYPSMRLFRQANPADWQGVMADVYSALNSFIQA